MQPSSGVIPARPHLQLHPEVVVCGGRARRCALDAMFGCDLAVERGDPVERRCVRASPGAPWVDGGFERRAVVGEPRELDGGSFDVGEGAFSGT